MFFVLKVQKMTAQAFPWTAIFFPSLVTKDYLPSTSYFVFLKLPDEEFLTSQFPDCFDKIVIGIDNWEVMIGILVCSCTLF